MKSKFLSIPILLGLGLALLILSSCGKENIDLTTTEKEEFNTEVLNCDQWQMGISFEFRNGVFLLLIFEFVQRLFFSSIMALDQLI